MTICALDELVEELRSLQPTPAKLQILSEVAAALVKPVTAKAFSADPILGSPLLLQYFSNVLLLHHATHEEKFKKKAFEFAFRGACRALGLKAALTNSTLPGADVVVENRKFSLKTEADLSISTTSIKISKLMEARWIRDVREGSRGADAVRHVTTHLRQYERVLTLRAFDVSRENVVRYELWEIPLDTTLQLVSTLQEKDFSTPTANNSYTAVVRLGSVPLFTLRLDGSVEKVTIAGLRTDACTRHACWEIPTILPSNEGESG